MENKKIYARQVPPEYQESPLQMCGEWPENVYAFGNRQYIERAERLNDIRAALVELGDTWEELNDGGRGWYNSWKEALEDIMPHDDTRGEYTRAERIQWAKLAAAWEWCASSQEDKLLCQALQLITGEKYKASCIRGCCQGDWQNIIYPASYGRAWLEAFEAEYFNTGTEWIIHDGDDAPEDPDEIDGYSVYCYTYNPRAEIAAEAGMDPENVILYEFDGYTRRAEWKVVS